VKYGRHSLHKVPAQYEEKSLATGCPRPFFALHPLTLFTFTCHAKSAQFLGWISLLLPGFRSGCDCGSSVAVIVA